MISSKTPAVRVPACTGRHTDGVTQARRFYLRFSCSFLISIGRSCGIQATLRNGTAYYRKVFKVPEKADFFVHIIYHERPGRRLSGANDDESLVSVGVWLAMFGGKVPAWVEQYVSIETGVIVVMALEGVDLCFMHVYIVY